MEKLKQLFDEILIILKDDNKRWLIIAPLGFLMIILYLTGSLYDKKKYKRAMSRARSRSRRRPIRRRRYNYRRRTYKRRR